MSGMIERVARAIYAADGGKGWHLHEQFYMAAARAAVEAMREPTEEMLFAADWLENGTRDAWSAMIDAALSEDGE